VPAAIFKVTAKRQRTHTKTLHDDNGIGVGINSNPALGQSRRIQVPTLSASRVKTRRLARGLFEIPQQLCTASSWRGHERVKYAIHSLARNQ
jgi:hypothetical protein